MKFKLLPIIFFLLGSAMVFAQTTSVQSPNQKINIALYNQDGLNTGSWYLKIIYSSKGISKTVIPRIDLGLVCSTGD